MPTANCQTLASQSRHKERYVSRCISSGRRSARVDGFSRVRTRLRVSLDFILRVRTESSWGRL